MIILLLFFTNHCEMLYTVGPGFVGLVWVGLGWVGFGWVGLDWVGLGWFGLALVWVFRFAIPAEGFQFQVSPSKPPSCRFTPRYSPQVRKIQKRIQKICRKDSEVLSEKIQKQNGKERS